MLRTCLRSLLAVLAATAVFAVIATDADARSKGSMGSRGTRTHSAPPSTATAPNSARPIERSAVQPGTPSTVGRPATPATQQPGGFFSRPGLLGGLAAGFLGAGLFGLLSGSGFMGGLGSLASFFGLLLQIGIVVGVALLLWRWWQSRSQPATAGGPSLRQGLAGGDSRSAMGIGALGGFGGGAATTAAPVEVKPEDFEAFEKLLGEVQTAYGKEDLTALRARVTPEMLSYYSEELSRNASAGDINQISDVKLLQGDLAEAWREGDDEYATVAMRYSLNDRIVARDDGRLIEQLPSEATELWTFRRARSGNWILSAIQQTGQD
jgi:predicted lipid-binding transport protein (Tim44 family)